MPKPLQPADPAEIGPFRLDSRLHESPEGIVYLGSDPRGLRVEVALLTRAAAGDAAARDRFREAIIAATPRGVSSGPPPASGPGQPAPVVVAQAHGEAPWVATAHQEGSVGAGRFLEQVPLKRGWGVRPLGGPQFQAYWMSGPKGPAVWSPEPPAPAVGPGDTKSLATAVAALAALLALLGLLLLLLFSCEPREPTPPPPPIESPSPLQPTSAGPPPSPTPRPTPSKTPRPSQTGGVGTDNPAARPPESALPRR